MLHTQWCTNRNDGELPAQNQLYFGPSSSTTTITTNRCLDGRDDRDWCFCCVVVLSGNEGQVGDRTDEAKGDSGRNLVRDGPQESQQQKDRTQTHQQTHNPQADHQVDRAWAARSCGWVDPTPSGVRSWGPPALSTKKRNRRRTRRNSASYVSGTFLPWERSIRITWAICAKKNENKETFSASPCSLMSLNAVLMPIPGSESR